MADAIVKLSWRRLSSEQAVTGPGSAQGGICGTCFTLVSGITISCAHNMDALFNPNLGFDACRVFAVERGGGITELRNGCLQLYSDFDACVIAGYQSSTKYVVSQRQANHVNACELHGYEAHAAPFQCRVTPSGETLEIFNPQITSVAQDFHGLASKPIVFNVSANDVKLSNKAGFVIDVVAKVGLSGGPMLDADGAAVGLCSMGFPPDAHQKTQIGAIDIRQFPFI